MPYLEHHTRAGKTEIYSRCYSAWIHPPGMKRAKKANRTPAAMEKVNLRRLAGEFTILMNANFAGGDYHVTLTYCMEERPAGLEEAKRDRENFIRRLRRRMNKAGIPFRFILVTEVGSRGAVHHHLVMNQVPVEWVRRAWHHGRIDVRPLDDTGQYSRLAEYLAKYQPQWKRAGGKGNAYSRSRNLERPETRVRIVRDRGYFREMPRAKKGYYVDKDTVQQGVSEYTGYNFLRYILVEMNGRRAP